MAKRRVKLLESSGPRSGPTVGSWKPGEVKDVEEELAERLCEQGRWVYADSPEPAKKSASKSAGRGR